MPGFKLTDDRMWIPVKRGDGGTPQHKKKCEQYFNGMFPGGADLRQWDAPGVTISEYNQHECCWLGVSRDWKDIAIQCNQEVGVPAPGEPYDNKKYRAASLYMLPEQIAPYADVVCPDFLTKFYSPGVSIEPLVLDLPKNLVKDAKAINVDSRVLIDDVGSLAPGNYTVGPVAAHYLTFNGAAGAVTAINAAPAMTGDIGVTLIGNITEVTGTILSQTLAGFTLLFDSNAPHGGNPTQGWVITQNGGNIVQFHLRHQGPGLMEVRNMHYILTTAGVAGWGVFVAGIVVASTTSIHDMLLDNNGIAGGGASVVGINDNTPVLHFYNNDMWDDGNGSGFLALVPINANSLVANNVAYNCPVAGFDVNNSTCLFRNNTAYDNGADFARHALATGRANTSSDGSAADLNWGAGVGNVINEAALVGVLGVNDLAADFFDIRAGGPLVNTGTPNTIAARTAGIRGRPVPNGNGFTSRGPAEILIPAPTPPPDDGAARVHESKIGIGLALGIGI